MTSRAIDMTGKKYGCITAISAASRSSSGDIKWLFLCDCGVEFEANGYFARCGRITTCPACSSYRSRSASIKHGLTGTQEFKIWTGMMTRCFNSSSKDYENYGGRGISVCKLWVDSFSAFLYDMGPRPSPSHSIDRVNNDGDYEAGNCRWVTQKEQSRNKRNNVVITIDGVSKILAEWASYYGVSAGTASLRYKQGKRGAEIFKSSVAHITYNGLTDTIAGWSKRTGIKAVTISMRINKYKWPVDRALTEGALN